MKWFLKWTISHKIAEKWTFGLFLQTSYMIMKSMLLISFLIFVMCTENPCVPGSNPGGTTLKSLEH